MSIRRKPRSGVLLLVVLSLLVLFVLAGVTLLVVSGQYRRATVRVAKMERFGERPSNLLDGSVRQLLRGGNGMSPIDGHQLLEDLYGREGFQDQVVAAANTPDAQLTVVSFTLPLVAGTLPGVNGFYNGGLLTLTNGRHAGETRRILSYRETPDPIIVIESFDPTSTDGLAGSEFVVNGMPFNGTGAGLDASWTMESTHTLNGADVRHCLLPNYTAWNPGPWNPPPAAVFRGGLDESYDAADFQNMFLAWMPPRGPSETVEDFLKRFIPSFHRPSLLRYIRQETLNLADFEDAAVLDYPQLWRALILRPTKIDHPEFTGGNVKSDWPLGFDPDGGPWDVDNDNDGITDSVWLDLGYPVQVAEDGTTYKPLFAILCTDLDGRLNLNAHGNKGHEETSYNSMWTTPSFAAGGVSATARFPRGEGLGVAEIFLGTTDTPGTGLLSMGETGEMRRVFDARYGGATNRLPGRPGFDDETEPISGSIPFPYKHLGLLASNDNLPIGVAPGLFQTRPDVRGLTSTFIDLAGQPRTDYRGTGPEDNIVDDPYELNLVTANGRDTPFTVEELEPLLRMYDANLRPIASRLTATVLDRNLDYARLLTTHSFDIPVPNVLPDPASTVVRAALGDKPAGIRSLYTQSALGLAESWLDAVMPFEFAHNEKFNINRPFGDGWDNDGNGVVDEPNEGQLVGRPDTLSSTIGNDNPIVPPYAPARQIFARHLYCLVFALSPNLFATNSAGGVPVPYGLDLDLDGTTTPEETTRAVAQWAINVVDYRDADSIMTPFEYDKNPSNGWQVDGDLTTNEGQDRGIVWGMERPELLMTETLALHDRRTEDLSTDDGTPPALYDGGEDTDFDQRVPPKGSLFIELYNPWIESGNLDAASHNPHDGATSHPGNELHSTNVVGGRLHEGVRLDRLTPQLPGLGRSPVWRMLIYESGTSGSVFNAHTAVSILAIMNEKGMPVTNSAESVVRGGSGPAKDKLERAVYFVGSQEFLPAALNPSKANKAKPFGEEALTYLASQPSAPIKPGRYAVIGSGDISPGPFGAPSARVVSEIGHDPAGGNSRRIVLQPLINPERNQVWTFTGVNLAQNNWNRDFHQPAVAVVIDQAINRRGGRAGHSPSPRLNISEPVEGYPSTNASGEYDPPKDLPLDQAGEIKNSNRLIANYRAVVLQRLANPLLPFNPQLNPYITIDWMGADLQPFNGLEEDPTNTTMTPGPVESLERGAIRPSDTMLWPHQYRRDNFIPAPEIEERPYIFDYPVANTLGYLNTTYGSARAGIGPPLEAYKGQLTAGTFSMLRWPNRPYTTQYELLNVPKSSAWSFALDFSASGSGDEYRYNGGNDSFEHLFPFKSRAEDLGIHQLLDYAEAPDRFAGTERWYNEQVFDAATFKPPYHRLSRFRNPGRVNINTITDPRVWLAIAEGFPKYATTVFWERIDASRREDTGPLHPTQFGNPFRTMASADLMPNIGTLKKGASPPNGGSIDVGLLRAREDFPLPLPLFSTHDIPGPYPDPYDDINNAYYRHLPLQRLGNIISYHSNVFAVWSTVGFFEVRVLNNGRVQLGKEVGSDSGQIKRHRSFYIIDRSIPVGYEPGEDHNVEDTIILRRRLE